VNGPIVGPWDTSRSADGATNNDLPVLLTINDAAFTVWTDDVFTGPTINGSGVIEDRCAFFQVLGRDDIYFTGGFGFLAANNIAIFPRELVDARLQTITSARFGGIYDYGDWRVCRYLSYQAPVPARVYYDVRSSQTQLIGGYNQAGQNIGAAINDVVTSEAAFNYVDRNGYFVYRARQNATDRGIQATFGENTAAGELPYLVSLEIDYDPSYIYNDIQVTYSGTPNAALTAALGGTLVTFTDTLSTSEYSDRSLSVTQLVIDFAQTSNLGNYLLSQYRQPQLRVAQVTLSPNKRPQMFSQLLALDIGDRVTLNRRPIGANPISVNVMIIGVEHSINYESGDWIFRFNLMPQAIAALQTITFTLDTAQLDLLDDGNVIGWG
jgi:hypothetical protein